MRNNTWFACIGYLSAIFMMALLLAGSPVIAQNITGEPETDGTPQSSDLLTATLTPGTPTITPTPTPSVSPVILTWSEEMFFPQAVSFRIAIGLPLAQIRVITLVLEVEGQSTRAIAMNELFRSATADEQSIEIEHIWQVTPNDLLPIDSIINYHWDITTAQGEFISVPGVTDYNEPAANWVVDEDPNNRFSFIYPSEVLNVGPLRHTLESVYALLATHTGQNPQFRLALFSDKAPLEQCHLNDEGDLVVTGRYGTELVCEEPSMDTLISNLGFTPFEMPSSQGIQQELVRYYVDAFYGPIWAGRDVPDWFKSGLTYVYFPSEKARFLTPLRDATRNRRLLNLSEMRNRPDPTSPDLALWEAQSFGMVTYMAHQIGIDELFVFASSAGAGEPFTTSYQEAIEQPLDALLPNWNNWIFSTAAATDFLLQLYLGPTPIPTRTQTLTSFPPSPTFTATNTLTITPTVTVTGFLSATPLPSASPTITLTPQPATITPRPAGFRDPTTPTPTPVPADKGFFEELGDQQIVGIAAVIIIGLIVLAATYLQARQRPRW